MDFYNFEVWKKLLNKTIQLQQLAAIGLLIEEICKH